jgi:hypothetical protein
MWQLLEFAAWAISALLIGWMVWDAVRVGRTTTEAALLSSREGVDELFAEQSKQGR